MLPISLDCSAGCQCNQVNNPHSPALKLLHSLPTLSQDLSLDKPGSRCTDVIQYALQRRCLGFPLPRPSTTFKVTATQPADAARTSCFVGALVPTSNDHFLGL